MSPEPSTLSVDRQSGQNGQVIIDKWYGREREEGKAEGGVERVDYSCRVSISCTLYGLGQALDRSGKLSGCLIVGIAFFIEFHGCQNEERSTARLWLWVGSWQTRL